MHPSKQRGRILRSAVVAELVQRGWRHLSSWLGVRLPALGNRPIDRVADELLSPLTAMRSTAEILRDHPDLDPAERDVLLRALLYENHRLERFIDLLLNEAHYRADREEVRVPLGRLQRRTNSAAFGTVAI